MNAVKHDDKDEDEETLNYLKSKKDDDISPSTHLSGISSFW